MDIEKIKQEFDKNTHTNFLMNDNDNLKSCEEWYEEVWNFLGQKLQEAYEAGKKSVMDNKEEVYLQCDGCGKIKDTRNHEMICSSCEDCI